MDRIAQMEGEGRRLYSIAVEKPGKRRSLGGPIRRWKDNIGKDLQDVGISNESWFDLDQDRIQWRTFITAPRDFEIHKP